MQTAGKWLSWAKNTLVSGSNTYKELTEFLADDVIHTPIHIEYIQFILLTHLIIETIEAPNRDNSDIVGPGKLSLMYGLLNTVEENTGRLNKLADDALKLYVGTTTSHINNNEKLIITSQLKLTGNVLVADASENSTNKIKKMLHFQRALSATIDLILQKINALQIKLSKKKELAGILLHVVGKYLENPYSGYLIYQPPSVTRKKSSESDSESVITMEEADSQDESSASFGSSQSSDSDNSSSRKGSASQTDKKELVVTEGIVNNTPNPAVQTSPQSSANEGDAAATSTARKESTSSASNESVQPPSHVAQSIIGNRKSSLRRTIETFGSIDSSPKSQKPETKVAEPTDFEIITEKSEKTKAIIEAVLRKYEDLFKTITNNINAINTVKYNCQKLYDDCILDSNEKNNQPAAEADYIHIQELRADLDKLMHCQQNVLMNHTKIDELAAKYSSVEKAEALFSSGIGAYKNILNMRLSDLDKTINDLAIDGYGQENSCLISKKIQSVTKENQKVEGLIANISTDTANLEIDNTSKDEIIKNNKMEIEEIGKLFLKTKSDHEQASNIFNMQKELTIESVINAFNRRFTYKTYQKENFVVADKNADEIAQNIANRFWDGIPLFGWLINKCTGENRESRLTAAQQALSLIQEVNANRVINSDQSGFLTEECRITYSTSLTTFRESNVEYERKEKAHNENRQRLNEGIINLTSTINQNNLKIASNNTQIINHRGTIQRNASKIEKLNKIRKQILEIRDKLPQPNSEMLSALNVAKDFSNEKVAENITAVYRLVN